MSVASVHAVLWDADGVLQVIPGALTGAPIDEGRIRAIATELGWSDSVDEVVAVWSTFELSTPILEVVARVRAAGTACYLATNQDSYRASWMRKTARYREVLDGEYYSCEIGVAKPAAAFFEHIVSDFGVLPRQLLFLDDQPSNIAGARSAGLEAETWTPAHGVDRLCDILHAHAVPMAEPADPARIRRATPPGRPPAQQDDDKAPLAAGDPGHDEGEMTP